MLEQDEPKPLIVAELEKFKVKLQPTLPQDPNSQSFLKNDNSNKELILKVMVSLLKLSAFLGWSQLASLNIKLKCQW